MTRRSRLICPLLAVSLALPPLPGQAQPQLSRRLHPTVRSVFYSVGDTLQGLFVMMVLSGIRVVRRKTHLSHLELSNLPPDELASAVRTAAYAVINEPTVWTGILSSRVISNTVADPIYKLLAHLVSQPGLFHIFWRFLESAMGAAIGSIGFKLGEELWKEARLKLPSKADQEIAGRADELVTGLFDSTTNPLKPHQTRVAWLMMKNMMKVLMTDESARLRWLTRTWRRDVATGDFGLGILISISSGAISELLFPEAGALLSMMFGFAGGLASIHLPDSTKAEVNDQIRNLRRWTASNQVRRCRARLDQQIAAIEFHTLTYRASRDLRRALDFCRRKRAGWLNVLNDYAYVHLTRARALYEDYRAAVRAGNSLSAVKLRRMISQLQWKYLQKVDEIISIYRSEESHLEQILPRALEEPAKRILTCELRHLQILLDKFSWLFPKDQADTIFINELDMQWISLFYESGYLEENFSSLECRPPKPLFF